MTFAKKIVSHPLELGLKYFAHKSFIAWPAEQRKATCISNKNNFSIHIWNQVTQSNKTSYLSTQYKITVHLKLQTLNKFTDT